MNLALSLSTILVGFSGGTSWIGRLIRWFTGGDVNHAFLAYFDEDTNGWVVLGADTGGWIQTPFEDLRRNKVVRLYAPPPGVHLSVGLAAMHGRLGAGYDFGGLLGMTWVLAVRRLLKKRVRNPFAAKKNLFCSEAVDMVLDRSGVDIGIPDESTIDPAAEEKALVAWSGATGSFSGPYTIDEVLAVSAPVAA